MRAMYKMCTSCWAVINNCHRFWKIALFLLATIHISIFYWLSCKVAHPYRECRGEWFPIVIIASIKIMTIIEWDNIHDHHHSPPLYKLYNLSIWRHSSPHILDISLTTPDMPHLTPGAQVCMKPLATGHTVPGDGGGAPGHRHHQVMVYVLIWNRIFVVMFYIWCKGILKNE